MEGKRTSVGKKYVYDRNEKDYYISKGIKMIDSDIHIRTKKQFWVFLWSDVSNAFNEWRK